MSKRENSPGATGIEENFALPYVIATWPKGIDIVKITIESFRGQISLHVREWWQDKSGQEKPGRGLAIPLADLPKLCAGLEIALLLALDQQLLR